MEVFDNINYLAVIVAAIAYWLIGALWYSPMLFAKPWARYVNFQEEWRKGMVLSMVLSFIGFLIISFTMAIFISYLVYIDMERSIKIALLAGIGFMAVPMYVNYLYNKKPIGLFFIDAGYHFVGFLVVALILSLWT